MISLFVYILQYVAAFIRRQGGRRVSMPGECLAVFSSVITFVLSSNFVEFAFHFFGIHKESTSSVLKSI